MERTREVSPLLRRARACAAERAVSQVNVPLIVAQRLHFWKWKSRRDGETAQRGQKAWRDPRVGED